MDDSTLTCRDEQRRHEVRRNEDFNGLDYLEVSDDQLTLTVYFLEKAPEGLVKENVRIKGGRRIRDVRVVDLRLCRQDDPELDDCMIVMVDKPGDFSTYTLCLVALDEDGRPTDKPFPGLDPRYACLEFSFKVNCPSDLDCKTEAFCPPEIREQPEINYLAKDYASFRQLILDRLAVIMPDWQERHVPDLGIALVELLAYVGDHLSYYQDAVATEAYLDTARQRISVRRHARLVDYTMHEGCNARAWLFMWTGSDVTLQADEISFITGLDDALPASGRVLSWDDLRNIPASQYEVFEPMVENPAASIQLYQAHNETRFYTWGDRECCLPRGATSATLIDGGVITPPVVEQTAPQESARKYEPAATAEETQYERELHLQPDDILIFEEVIGPKTGNRADANPGHRHAVRLTSVEQAVDELYRQPVLEIAWAEEEALPFPLCISAIGPAPDCELIENISVARGNVILVDHGRRIEDEPLGCVPVAGTMAECGDKCQPAEVVTVASRFAPSLQESPLTFSQPLPGAASATALLVQDPRHALPWIRLVSFPDPDCVPSEPEEETPPEPPGEPEEEIQLTPWMAQRDLLASSAQDHHYVAEIDNEGRAHLRFGDGELGRKPEAVTAFRATYRVGIGPAGNVGAGAISIMVSRGLLEGVVLKPRNPLSAKGGTAPEPLAEVKLFAPHAFRRDLQRAITEADHAELVMRDFKHKVQQAAGRLSWTGSWYEVLVAIDPGGQVEAEQELLDDIAAYLGPYRRIGRDVVVKQGRYVPLLVELTVCVLPHYLRGHVKAALMDLFSSRTLPGGRLGFFHPDNLSFGEGIYLSKLVAAAQALPGVESVKITKLERLFEGPNDEIKYGILPLGPLEIARLDNDPGFPENGQLKLTLGGGR